MLAYVPAELLEINHYGFMTINSQPRADAVPSMDKTLGWGSANGTHYLCYCL